MRQLERVMALVIVIAAAACDEGVAGDSPAQLRMISGTGQSGVVGTKLAQPLVVEVRGFDTLPLPGVRVDFRVSSGLGAVSPASAVTDAAGRASTELTIGARGITRVTAAVFSSSMSVSFLATAGGGGTSLTCQPSVARSFVPAQIEAGLGGDGICLSGGGGGATYVLVGSNSDTLVGSGAAVRLDVSGNVLPAVINAASSRDSTESRSAFTELSGIPRSPANVTTSYAPGDVRLFNVNLADNCAAAVMRPARIVAVTATAIVAADTTNPAAGWTDDELRDFAIRFDTLYNPTDTLNFRAPADVDANGRILFLFTRAVNEAAPVATSHSTVAFRRWDLFPQQTTPLLPSACATSNQGELLYVAVPGVSGRTKTQLQAELPRATVHAYQHLINASRRLHVNSTARVEEPWLDEALSSIAEELLFYAGASSASRRNLAAFDLALRAENVASFQAHQRSNVEDYAAFLQSPGTVTPAFVTDSRAARGAGWSLLRYLADRRGGPDFVTWTQLVNSREAGMRNLLDVFGHQLPDMLRDWALSVLVDDLFSAPEAFRQPSWNLRSIYSALGHTSFPLNIASLSAGSSTVTILSAGAAYFSIRVPAGGTVGVTWSASGGGPPPALVQWSIVRTQ